MKMFTITLYTKDETIKKEEVASSLRLGLEADISLRAGDYIFNVVEED